MRWSSRSLLCMKAFIFKHLRHYSAPAILHAKLVRNCSLTHLSSLNHLLHLYVKHQLLDDAHKLFDEMPDRDVRTWTVLISGFAKKGLLKTVLPLFSQMQAQGSCPNQFTLSSVLKCCARANQVRVGKAVHGWMLSTGVCFDVVLENSVLDLYVKCGALNFALRLFEMMKVRDPVSWNIVIGGCFQVGDNEKALQLFGIMPCKDVGSWNTVIDGLTRNGAEAIALKALYQMMVAGPALNTVTLSTALILASKLLDLDLGKQLHAQVLRCQNHTDGFVVNSLVHMYSKCDETATASLVFGHTSRDMTLKNYRLEEDIMDAAAWSSMVSGCVQNGRWEDALETFCNMVRGKLEVHMFILTSILSACADSGRLEFGQLIHAYAVKLGYRPDVSMSCALIDMYAKCGSSDDAHLIFRQTHDRNVVLWTSMISCCALNGDGLEAKHFFDSMIKEGVKPNAVTFVSILTACIHAGLVEDGCRYFHMMMDVYGIKPEAEHLTCMVDLYGRANRFGEAKRFIHENDMSGSVAAWSALLSSCRFHKNSEMAKLVTDHLVKLKSADSGALVMLSNLCANEERWEDSNEIRTSMKQKGIEKPPGQSWIQLKNQVHIFSAGNQSHPQHAAILSRLESLTAGVKEIGYSPNVIMVTQDVEEEQAEAFLRHHSEKLAVAFGIMSAGHGSPIRVMKNLRVCCDCHDFIKYTSRLLNREIIVRDIHRFHHFKNGSCSCGDYW
uniref:DYW domain-containing protein n=1 Tax=Kalanchoe fedtschenkoi TaxID=63787 RepID=A0A7N0USZ1_KALFE